jgi:hypothetical protein
MKDEKEYNFERTNLRLNMHIFLTWNRGWRGIW